MVSVPSLCGGRARPLAVLLGLALVVGPVAVGAGGCRGGAPAPAVTTVVDPDDGVPATGSLDPAAEARAVALLQADRARAGVTALEVSPELTALARHHSARMAGADRLHHNPDLVTDVVGWAKVGENVGRGPDVDRIHAGFRGSPSHARNLDDPDWTLVGIGVVVHDGQRWVTQVFAAPG